jgi:hypothetical protein
MNIKNFRKVLQYIEAHPEEWDQRWPFTGNDFEPCCFLEHAWRLLGEPFISSSLGTYQDLLDMKWDEMLYLFDPKRELNDFRRVLWVYGRYA